MVDPHHPARELREDSSEVAGPGADVEDSATRAEVGQERLARRGVHVRRGDRGAVADGLGRVFVGGAGVGAEVRAVDGGHGAVDERGGDEARGREVADELSVAAAGAAPCHGWWVAVELGALLDPWGT